MKVNIHRADARGNVLATLTGTRIVFRGKQFRVPRIKFQELIDIFQLALRIPDLCIYAF